MPYIKGLILTRFESFRRVHDSFFFFHSGLRFASIFTFRTEGFILLELFYICSAMFQEFRDREVGEEGTGEQGGERRRQTNKKRML